MPVAQRGLELVQVNIAALVHLRRLFLPGMVERGWRRVLTVGSSVGFQRGLSMATEPLPAMLFVPCAA